MSIWLPVIVTAVICYAAKYRKGRAATATKPRTTPVTRSQQLGEEGEALVHAELLSALQWLCGDDFYLHPGALLLNHAPGTDFPTAEVDHLAVTPFGIFVVETKHWAGHIEPGPTDATIVRFGTDGQWEMRRSPLHQNRSKVAFLRAMLPGIWAVEGIAAFSHPLSDISPALPVNIVRASDLRQWLRSRRSWHASAGGTRINVRQAQRAILAVSETAADAIDRHRAKLRENPKKITVFA
ncbi:nuclease-like protein [Paraburkholderia sp. RAU2J]|uniref:nuclease-related domain-containing protein n=1 Tax=Paraburkholderia sp. RAU2J TaxID=1938810 RepID=UPI000EAE9455|nr:nuclease-related domain-containing protein [Paraburkholderia sp. RAU2J]RKT10641.1 nuclease-like protein [Paraburkholderia sp. RAU2J]